MHTPVIHYYSMAMVLTSKDPGWATVIHVSPWYGHSFDWVKLQIVWLYYMYTNHDLLCVVLNFLGTTCKSGSFTACLVLLYLCVNTILFVCFICSVTLFVNICCAETSANTCSGSSRQLRQRLCTGWLLLATCWWDSLWEGSASKQLVHVVSCSSSV